MSSGSFKMLPINYSHTNPAYICINKIWTEITHK